MASLCEEDVSGGREKVVFLGGFSDKYKSSDSCLFSLQMCLQSERPDQHELHKSTSLMLQGTVNSVSL